MTSNEIIEKLDKLITLIQANSQAINLIEQLALAYPDATRRVSIALGADKELDRSGKNALGNDSNQIIEVLKNLKVGVVFVELNSLINGFKKIERDYTIITNPLRPLVEKLENFYDAFEHSVGNFEINNAFRLMRIAYSINDIFVNNLQMAKAFRDMLLEKLTLEEGNQEISIYFASPIKFDELIAKLSAIQALYDELSRLLNVSTNEYPLEIAKLEVGSLWLKLFGESKVIALLTSLTEKSVSFLHRAYTKEGKIQAIPKNAEVINNLLELSKNLKENGIDTKVLDENIEHSAILISNQLNKLLVGEPNVKINDNEHYIGKELDEKLLQERKTLLLESGKSEDNKKV